MKKSIKVALVLVGLSVAPSAFAGYAAMGWYGNSCCNTCNTCNTCDTWNTGNTYGYSAGNTWNTGAYGYSAGNTYGYSAWY